MWWWSSVQCICKTHGKNLDELQNVFHLHTWTSARFQSWKEFKSASVHFISDCSKLLTFHRVWLRQSHPLWMPHMAQEGNKQTHKQIYILIIMIKQATRLKRKGVDNLQLWSTRSGQNKRNTCSVLYNWRTEARGKLSIWAWFIRSLGGSTVFVQVLLWLCPFTANVWCLCSYYRD